MNSKLNIAEESARLSTAIFDFDRRCLLALDKIIESECIPEKKLTWRIFEDNSPECPDSYFSQRRKS